MNNQTIELQKILDLKESLDGKADKVLELFKSLHSNPDYIPSRKHILMALENRFEAVEFCSWLLTAINLDRSEKKSFLKFVLLNDNFLHLKHEGKIDDDLIREFLEHPVIFEILSSIKK